MGAGSVARGPSFLTSDCGQGTTRVSARRILITSRNQLTCVCVCVCVCSAVQSPLTFCAFELGASGSGHQIAPSINTRGDVWLNGMRARTDDNGERIQEEEANQPAAAPSSAHVSPAMRIYRHALESVFAMLELGDLSQILAVSRPWSAALRSMKTINASIDRDADSRSSRATKVFRPLPPVASIVGSRLLRHVAAIQVKHQYADWTAGQRVSCSPGATCSQPDVALLHADSHTKRAIHSACKAGDTGAPT